MIRLCIISCLLGWGSLEATYAQAPASELKGVMLNLNMERVKDGLIPSKSFYPLFVPLDNLKVQIVQKRALLVFRKNQGLDVPPSSLLDPSGASWVVTLRAFPKSDGIILQHANADCGYTIRIRKEALEAVIHSGGKEIILKEDPKKGITNCLGKWIVVELHISPDEAILVLNRVHIARVALKKPPFGTDFQLRLGQPKLSAPLREDLPDYPWGFSGGLSKLKFLRQ